MSSLAPSTPQDAVAGLIAVSCCAADPERGHDAIGEVAEALRGATRADLVVVWSHDPREADGRVIALAGPEALPDAALAALARHGLSSRTDLGATEGPLQSALAAAGTPRGVAVPVAPASRGLVVVAGAGPELDHEVRAAALRAGVARIETLIDVLRMRDNLERAMAQILATDERMLGRMGLDIHDGPTQQLSVALLEVQLLEADLADAVEGGMPAPESLRPAVGRIYETVGGALHEMRELIGHLRPAQFEDRRLVDILEDAVVAFESRADCAVTREWVGEFPVNGVSITQRITLYRILQETLTNAQRHGQARAVAVRALEDERGVTMEVTDDGRGFDPEAVQRRRPGMPLARFGLHGMRDRAQILGGSFDIASAPGRGTTVRVFLPRWDGPAPEVPIDAA
ncbi:sensor histidine kinase [Miltoncostaea marina]|uniref:sensor histidine kinase n=1 Tax=Miltoncostaea marina TaxID=2843215 RepID=UPI001C3E466D|nr:sensor histidine kinase [Miltoncostaea marina]